MNIITTCYKELHDNIHHFWFLINYAVWCYTTLTYTRLSVHNHRTMCYNTPICYYYMVQRMKHTHQILLVINTDIFVATRPSIPIGNKHCSVSTNRPITIVPIGHKHCGPLIATCRLPIPIGHPHGYVCSNTPTNSYWLYIFLSLCQYAHLFIILVITIVRFVASH